MDKYVKKIAVGTAQFGMPYGIANHSGQVDENEVGAIINLACNNRIYNLDTAKSYGTSEEIIGNYINLYPDKHWKINTKFLDNDNSLINQFNDSVEKLTVYPSVIMAHSADFFSSQKFQEEIPMVINKNSEIKLGVSIYNEYEIRLVLNKKYKPDVIQVPLNILDTRLYQSGILTQLYDMGVEIHARSIFLQGLFFLDNDQINNSFPEVISELNKLKKIAENVGISLAKLSLLWVTSLPAISQVIIGVDNSNQLKEHLDTLTLSIDEEAFDKALKLNYDNEKILNPSNW